MNHNKESDAFWDDTIYGVCSGRVSDMREIRRLDVFEFFAYMEKRWQKK
jgi:hypothetical protein